MAHLLNFEGSDTLSACYYAQVLPLHRLGCGLLNYQLLFDSPCLLKPDSTASRSLC